MPEEADIQIFPGNVERTTPNGQLQTVNWAFEALIVDDIAP